MTRGINSSFNTCRVIQTQINRKEPLVLADYMEIIMIHTVLSVYSLQIKFLWVFLSLCGYRRSFKVGIFVTAVGTRVLFDTTGDFNTY